MFAASLRLRRVLPRDVAADVVLFLRYHRALLLDLPFEREPALGALLDEARVAAPVRLRGAALEMQHVIGDFVQKRAVVADDDDGLVEIADVFLQPGRGLEVEM